MELQGQSFQVVGEAQAVCDPAWTAEALGNVLKNCMEHTPASGSITVTLWENPIYSQILVEDTGPGICQEDLLHLFERFYRGQNAAPQSAGIGLALARMIITAQNGTIQASNRREGGARFTIRFYKQSAPPPHNPLRPPETPRTMSRRGSEGSAHPVRFHRPPLSSPTGSASLAWGSA